MTWTWQEELLGHNNTVRHWKV